MSSLSLHSDGAFVFPSSAQTPPSSVAPGAATQRGFSPYDFNGGTTLAISGPDFAVVAGERREDKGKSGREWD